MVADKLLTRSELPDLYTGVTFADFHAVGTIPEFKDRFIMCVTGAAIILAQSFRRFGDKESVPAVFSFKISEFFLDEDNGDIRESENRFGSKKIFLVMLPYKVDQWLGCHLHFCDNI